MTYEERTQQGLALCDFFSQWDALTRDGLHIDAAYTVANAQYEQAIQEMSHE